MIIHEIKARAKERANTDLQTFPQGVSFVAKATAAHAITAGPRQRDPAADPWRAPKTAPSLKEWIQRRCRWFFWLVNGRNLRRKPASGLEKNAYRITILRTLKIIPWHQASSGQLCSNRNRKISEGAHENMRSNV